MLGLALHAAGGVQIEAIARTFGVDWPHLLAQTLSFAIVCVLLQRFAYKPILRILEARRQQIATGLVDAEKIREELGRIEVERRYILLKAQTEGKQLVE